MKKLTNLSGIQLRRSGINENSSLGFGKVYHQPLHRIYIKGSFTLSTVRSQYVVNVALKATNNNMVENVLVPSRLVFGTIPRFSILNTSLPIQNVVVVSIKTNHSKMNTIFAQRRIFEALARNIPPAANRLYKVGENVFVHSENKKG